MTQLKVLGAQRIKALSEIIDEQCKSEVKSMIAPSRNQVQKELLTDAELNEIQTLQSILEDTMKTLNDKRGKSGIAYELRKIITSQGELAEETQKQLHQYRTDVKAVKAKHEKRKQLLWLCETLEEAKQIVGI